MDSQEVDRWKRLAKACDMDPRLKPLPEGVVPQPVKPPAGRPTEAKRRATARQQKRERLERIEAFRKQRDDLASQRGRLRGKQAAKPIGTGARPGKGVRKP